MIIREMPGLTLSFGLSLSLKGEGNSNPGFSLSFQGEGQRNAQGEARIW